MTFKSTFPTPKETRRATYVRNMHRALMATVSDGATAGSPRAIWLFTPASRNQTGIGSRAGRQPPPRGGGSQPQQAAMSGGLRLPQADVSPHISPAGGDQADLAGAEEHHGRLEPIHQEVERGDGPVRQCPRRSIRKEILRACE